MRVNTSQLSFLLSARSFLFLSAAKTLCVLFTAAGVFLALYANVAICLSPCKHLKGMCGSLITQSSEEDQSHSAAEL